MKSLKRFDKLKYYGGIGKRSHHNDEQEELYELADLVNMLEQLQEDNDAQEDSQDDSTIDMSKRLDKMKYFGSLGKRSAANNNYDSMVRSLLDSDVLSQAAQQQQPINNNQEELNALRRKYIKLRKEHMADLSKKSQKSQIDKLRYMGGIGK